MHEGHCLCGGLRFRVNGDIQAVENCHCGMCRRAHGTPFSTFARVAAEDLEITHGEERVERYRSSEKVERSFCRTCGTRFTFRFDGLPELIWVAAGTLEDDPKLAPSAHIFVGSKASWHQILDDLPQHEAYPPQD